MEGINNKIWGPVYWRMFHYITLTYPTKPKEENKLFIKNFFTEIIPNILPCPICRNHYKENLTINPLTDDILEIKLKLVIWLINMHNYVNKQLNKEELTIEDALVSMFLPINLNLNLPEEDNLNDKYNKNYLENTFVNLIYPESFIYNINEIYNQKEEDLKNEKILEEQENKKKEYLKNLYEKDNLINGQTKKNYEKKKEEFNKIIEEIKNKINLPKDNGIKNVEITLQENIDINKIIDKMCLLINNQKSNQNRYLIYTAFETLCLLFI